MNIKLRILSVIPLLLILSLVCFTFINPSEQLLSVARASHVAADFNDVEQVESGFFIRYGAWVRDCFNLDFGYSKINPDVTVVSIIGNSFPATGSLIIISFLIVIGVSVPVGITCAKYKNGWFDRIIKRITFVLTIMPVYWIGLIIIWYFHVSLVENYFIFPALAIALAYVPRWIKNIRNLFVDAFGQDYVLYARARGLSNSKVMDHIIKNTAPLFVNDIFRGIPQLALCMVIIENIFAVPGLGTLCTKALLNMDFPIIQTFVLWIGVLCIFANLAFDIIKYAITPQHV
ncbi:MAG: hypothetical protein BEN18_08295 [Epulopiscium sp. Nuni2H_MBin001]|nr:MAG: hypothetical protein BEN18_08295 [Epulopiscium sp. Nuni2H_MBin001]